MQYSKNNNILAGSPLHQKVLFSGALHYDHSENRLFQLNSIYDYFKMRTGFI